MKKVMSESTYDNKLRPDYYENNYANMAAAFIVETERWNLAAELFPEGKPETGYRQSKQRWAAVTADTAAAVVQPWTEPQLSALRERA